MYAMAQKKACQGGEEPRGEPGGEEETEKRYSRMPKTISNISLWVSLDESGLVGVGDLWAMTGMAVAVKGIMITSRHRLARKRDSEIRSGEGIFPSV